MKTVVITGTGQGIGLATAELFLKQGWYVIGTYHDSLPPVQSPQFTPVKLDLAVPESISDAVKNVFASAKCIDVLVNNSGILNDAFIEIPDIKKIRETFEVNVFGAIDFTERLLPLMSSGSKIVNLSSTYGSFAVPIDDGTTLGYRMSKAAINIYTRSLAFRLKDRGIVVFSVHPGWVKTKMGNSLATEDAHPTREPSDAAQDIFDLSVNEFETGLFWSGGKRMDW